MIGEVVAGRFEVGPIAGRGGMATVHEARDRETGARVALKIVAGAHANARFEREANVLARLRDPGIVKYVAHGSLGPGRMFLAMEWLEGKPLDEALEGGPMELRDTVAIIARLARALAAAHVDGIVHRDVKPANVILRGGRTDDAVLVDFGIARVTDASQAMTATGAVIGTPQYMAPEQVRGALALDARVDVFALGCVLFECLAGRPPFSGQDIVAVLAKILLEPAPRVSTFRRDVPRAIDDLVASMLEKAPDARPPSIGRIAAVLEGLGPADSSAAVAPAAPVLGSTEQRLATVLLARPRAVADAHDDAALADTEALLAGITGEALREVGAKLGLTLHQLADGSLVAALSPEQGGADAASRIVQCAHVLAREMPAARIAVATGRAIVAGALPVGEAIDLATQLFVESSAPGVVVCPATTELVEARRAPPQRSRTLLGKTTPCVGRDRELALLDATLRECIDEPVARAVLVIASPGIGKSRLQRELVARAGDSVEVWLGLADPLMETAPFAFVGDLLRRVFGVVEGEPIETRRKKILARVTAVGLDGAIARRLGEISGTPFEDGDDAGLRAARRDPPLLAAQATDALASFVSEETRRPHLLVLEDVHWADAASLRVLGSALDRARDNPLLVLALARPSVDEIHSKLWEEHRCQRFVLEPLLRKAAERLARAVLGEGTDVDAIVRRAAGNALFVEELARVCAEGRAPTELPATIAAVTEARLTALPPDARRTLRAAALIGERFWTGALARLIGAREATGLDDTLRFLEDHELINGVPASRFEGEREMLFRHAIVRDVAYAMLTPDDRRLGHALAAEWLRERTDDGALLAHHFEAGGRSADAARWHAHAAEQALAAQDFATVFRAVARAEACGANADILGPARLAEADAHLWLGANDAAAKTSLSALAALPRGSEKWFLAVGTHGAAVGKLGDLDALNAVTSELESTPASDEPSGRARAIARARVAIQLAYFGSIRRADALLDRCEEERGATDTGVRAWILEAAVERGIAAGEPLHPSVVRRARELRLEIGDNRGAAALLATESQVLATVGAFDDALKLVEELQHTVGPESRMFMSYTRMIRCSRAAMDGDVDPFLDLAKALPATANPRLAGSVYSFVARFLLVAGRIEAAEEWAARSIDLPGASPGPRALALAVRAKLSLLRGEIDAALADSIIAVEGSGLAGIWVGAFIHLAYVDALAAAGRTAESRTALTTAVEATRHAARHLGEYRDTLFRTADYEELFRRADT